MQVPCCGFQTPNIHSTWLANTFWGRWIQKGGKLWTYRCWNYKHLRLRENHHQKHKGSWKSLQTNNYIGLEHRWTWMGGHEKGTTKNRFDPSAGRIQILAPSVQLITNSTVHQDISISISLYTHIHIYTYICIYTQIH